MAPKRTSKKPVELQKVILTFFAALIAIGGALLAAPNIGNAMRVTARQDETDRDMKLLQSKFASLEQVVREQGKEISGINSRLDKLDSRIDKLDATVIEGNRRTEETLREMTGKFADVSASARAIERSVASITAIAHASNANSENAVVRADQALKEVEKINQKARP